MVLLMDDSVYDDDDVVCLGFQKTTKSFRKPFQITKANGFRHYNKQMGFQKPKSTGFAKIQ